MIAMQGVQKYFGANHVLKDIDLTVAPGEKLVVIGPSGSGKSTLIRSMNLLEAPSEGEIIVDGVKLTAPNAQVAKVRESVAMVFQQFNLYPHKTVLENLTLAPVLVKKVPKDEAEETGLAFLERVGLKHKAHAYPSELSGGQQQRVAVARAIAQRPQVLLLDEATSNLDIHHSLEILHLIRNRFEQQGMQVVAVMHDLNLAAFFCDRLIFLKQGEIVCQGPTEAVLTPENIARVYGVEAEVRPNPFTNCRQVSFRLPM